LRRLGGGWRSCLPRRQTDDMRLWLHLEPVGQRFQPVDRRAICAPQDRAPFAIFQRGQPGDDLLDLGQRLGPAGRRGMRARVGAGFFTGSARARPSPRASMKHTADALADRARLQPGPSGRPLRGHGSAGLTTAPAHRVRRS
jgi:hypothetical protein